MFKSSKRRVGNSVFPSGVAFTFTIADPEVQAEYLKRISKGKVISAWGYYLKNTLLSVGNKTDIDDEFIKRMLEADPIFALFTIRNFTFRSTEFHCTVDFATKDGTKGAKEEHTIDLESLQHKPYNWVEDVFSWGLEEEIKKDYPIVYDSYSQMLEEQRGQIFLMKLTEEDSQLNGIKELAINWQLPIFGAKTKTEFDYNDFYDVRKPTYTMTDPDREEASPETLRFSFEGKDIDPMYGASFRTHCEKIEGFVDTTITLVSKKNSRDSETVNLLAVKEFFSPSL